MCGILGGTYLSEITLTKGRQTNRATLLYAPTDAKRHSFSSQVMSNYIWHSSGSIWYRNNYFEIETHLISNGNLIGTIDKPIRFTWHHTRSIVWCFRAHTVINRLLQFSQIDQFRTIFSSGHTLISMAFGRQGLLGKRYDILQPIGVILRIIYVITFWNVASLFGVATAITKIFGGNIHAVSCMDVPVLNVQSSENIHQTNQTTDGNCNWEYNIIAELKFAEAPAQIAENEFDIVADHIIFRATRAFISAHLSATNGKYVVSI